jgi:hypothetical protein
MRLTRFLIVQSTVLGTCAFVAWALLGSSAAWPLRLSLDTLAAAAIGVLLTAMFLLVVAWPSQLALRSNRSLLVRVLVGAASGPVGVWLGLLLLTGYPIGWEWYVVRAGTLHAVFAAVGAAFALAWYRRLRPNHSFKPTPLRGAA